MGSSVHPADSNLSSTLRETRLFPPSKEFSDKAHIQSREAYDELYRRSVERPEDFWGEVASELEWMTPWQHVRQGTGAETKWFAGGELNLCVNSVDRHAVGDKATHPAIVWEGEPGEVRTLTFAQLHEQVQRFANVLKGRGVVKGDRVAIYMGMVPELAIAVLACARIGAVHSVIFGGFAAHAIVDRVNDSKCKIILTQDGSYRRGSEVKLKPIVDEALASISSVESVIVFRRTGTQVDMKRGRDFWWQELMEQAEAICPPEPMQSEDPLFILYTSGTTGKPKGLVHTTAGYAVGTYLTSKLVFDLRPDDVYWCTADIGWITGHSYVLYGVLQNGVTTLLYEGAPNHPDPSRFWKIIDRHKVTIFYTAPTAIRSFIKWGNQHLEGSSLDSLRLLGTVGEPINPEAWMWYYEKIGHGRCPIADTWWQTETGAHMIAPLPGAIALKPGSATLPVPGIVAKIVTKEGDPVPAGSGGLLVVSQPWPSIARTIWGDHQRYLDTYWSEVPGCYFTGDGARTDEDGYFWLMGRVDDVINVSGHRLGTMEIESVLVAHAKVAEAAVVARPDELKGQGIVAFVTLEEGYSPDSGLKDELRAWVAHEIGALARPDEVRFTEALPKTRSGKIMRRLLRELASGGEIKGDTTTLEDFSVLARLKEKDES